MISPWLANAVLIASLIVSLAAYVSVSKREGSYLNILTPALMLSVPSYFLLPLFFIYVFGTGASPYAFTYIYATLAMENVAFAYAYTRPTRIIRLPLRYSYSNFGLLSFALLGLALLMYAPVLLQFPEYLLDPRQIYAHTRTGFGINFYISTTFAYLAVILIEFTDRSGWVKGFVILVAAVLISLHGSKGQLLSLVFLLALFEVYVKGRRFRLLPSLLVGAGLGFFLLLLFAASMALGDGTAEALETISQYSDYTRNAMLIIDSHFPLQYGRLTMEGATFGRIPRLLMPNKPKNFGVLYLDDQFFPEYMDADAGAPDFGIGLQYADFGALAIVYLAAFTMLRGWLARIFVSRLKHSRHPADFFLVVFFAEISIFPVGGVGWLLPEALAVSAFFCFASRVGANKVFRERWAFRPRLAPQLMKPTNSTGSL